MEPTGVLWKADITCTNCARDMTVTDKDVKHRPFKIEGRVQVRAYVECPHCRIHVIMPSLFLLVSAGRAVFYSIGV